ncbi:hypothetical protein ANTPLA_LOCUS2327 [Anthophora plagiata]
MSFYRQFRFQNEFSSQHPKATEGHEKVVRIKVVEGFYSVYIHPSAIQRTHRSTSGAYVTGIHKSNERPSHGRKLTERLLLENGGHVSRRQTKTQYPRRPISVERTLADRHTVPRRVSRAATIEQ